MNKTLQGQRAFPGSLKRIKLWGLCTSQCVNNKPAVDALKKQNSWCFPYLERASPSLLRRFKYFICEVRYKGRYELPPPAASEGLRNKKSPVLIPRLFTRPKMQRGKEKKSSNCSVQRHLANFLGLFFLLSLFASLSPSSPGCCSTPGTRGHPGTYQTPFVYFQIYLRK